MINESAKVKGTVERIIKYKDGRKEINVFENTILTTGKSALVNSLANIINDVYDYYIANMIFGTNGTTGNVEKFVPASRVGLFGITRVQKPVIASVNPADPTQATFTSVLTFDDGNGYGLNEMALVMGNGDLYSMVTFPDLAKTSQMQITFNWNISMV